MTVYEKALFGAFKPSVLFNGSSVTGDIIRTTRWKGRFLAFAVDSAVRVMDMDNKVIVSLIKRDHSFA